MRISAADDFSVCRRFLSFGVKNMGRKFNVIMLMTAFLAASSCMEDSWESRRSAVPADGVQSSGEGQPQEAGISYYLAAAVYPDGYDWLKDPQYGSVECEILLLEEDGDEVLRFQAGHEYGISTDADMIRCSGAHVFTDYSTEGETVIGRDGEEIFRYPGREMLKGFLEYGGTTVFTLGVPREGGGWRFRKNGAVMAASEEGVLTSGLYQDEGKTVFTSSVTYEEGYQTLTMHYIVQDGVMSQVKAPETGQDIVDIRMWKGEVCMLAQTADGSSGWLYRNYMPYELEAPDGMSLKGADSILADSCSVYVLGRAEDADGDVRAVLWRDMSVHVVFEKSFKVVACYPDGGKAAAVGYYDDDWSNQYLYLDGNYIGLPEGYVLISSGMGNFMNGRYCIGLNPMDPSLPPAYVLDGQIYEIPVNGCLLGLGVASTLFDDVSGQ